VPSLHGSTEHLATQHTEAKLMETQPHQGTLLWPGVAIVCACIVGASIFFGMRSFGRARLSALEDSLAKAQDDHLRIVDRKRDDNLRIADRKRDDENARWEEAVRTERERKEEERKSLKTAAQLAKIKVQSIKEQKTFELPIRISGPDASFGRVSYKLLGKVPMGCSIDETTGVLTWTPTESQGPSRYHLTVAVEFASTPQLNNMHTFAVTVTEVNRQPILTPVPDQVVERGKPIRLQVVASDPDWPANGLTYELGKNAPAEASLDRLTGTLTWTPNNHGPLGRIEIPIRVVDDGTPASDGSMTVRFKVFKWMLKATPVHRLQGHTDGVRSTTHSPDGKRLATASNDMTVKVWDAATGQESLTLKGHSGPVLCVVFSPDGKRLASASEDNTVKVWDATTGQESLTLEGHAAAVGGVSFSPDGKRLASASADRTAIVWDTVSGDRIFTLEGHSDQIWSVSFSPNSKRLVTASGLFPGKPGEVKVWDADKGQELFALKGHKGFVRSVVFSPDSQQLASGGEDQRVRVWDAATGKQLFVLKGHTSYVSRVLFSPNGKWLASASDRFGEPGEVRVWDVATREALLTQQLNTGVTDISFSPNGKQLVSASWDNTVEVSGLEPVRVFTASGR
jgi:WD40 repeat protein